MITRRFYYALVVGITIYTEFRFVFEGNQKDSTKTGHTFEREGLTILTRIMHTYTENIKTCRRKYIKLILNLLTLDHKFVVGIVRPFKLSCM